MHLYQRSSVLVHLNGSGAFEPAEGCRSCRSLVRRLRGAEAPPKERSEGGRSSAEPEHQTETAETPGAQDHCPRMGQLFPALDNCSQLWTIAPSSGRSAGQLSEIIVLGLLVGSAEIEAQSSGSDWSP